MYSLKISVINSNPYQQFFLNYLSKKKYNLGNIIEIPFGNRVLLGVIVGISDVIQDKTMYKNLESVPKIIKNQEIKIEINQEKYKNLEKTATENGVSLGFMLNKAPFVLLKNLELKDDGSEIKLISNLLEFTNYNDEKLNLVICPTKKITKSFEKFFSNELPEKKIKVINFKDLWLGISNDLKMLEKINLLIINPSSEGFRDQKYPKINLLDLFISLIKNSEIKIFYYDFLFLAEKENYLIEIKELIKKIILIDVPKNKDVFNNDLIKFCQNEQDSKTVFYYLADKNKVATSVICNDCHKNAQDEKGNEYFVIQDKDGVNWYKNNEKQILARHTCQFCNSTNLKMLGITNTIQKSYFSDFSKLNHNLLNFKPLSSLALYSYKTNGVLIIQSLNHLKKSFNFQSDENILKELWILSHFYKKIIIQTRKNDQSIVDYFQNPTKVIKTSITIRKKFNLPPYGKHLSFFFPLDWWSRNKKHLHSWLKDNNFIAKIETVKLFKTEYIRCQATVQNLTQDHLQEMFCWPLGYLYKIDK